MAESDPSMFVLQTQNALETHQQPQSTNHPHIVAAHVLNVRRASSHWWKLVVIQEIGTE
jgi:hypothetical protein